MTSDTIPKEALEAAAAATFQFMEDQPWEAASPEETDFFLDAARRALAAASPRVEYAIFRRSDGKDCAPVENLRYATRAGAQEWLDLGYSHPEFWEVRGRVVGPWTK